jgi:hypothetical protein
VDRDVVKERVGESGREKERERERERERGRKVQERKEERRSVGTRRRRIERESQESELGAGHDGPATAPTLRLRHSLGFLVLALPSSWQTPAAAPPTAPSAGHPPPPHRHTDTSPHPRPVLLALAKHTQTSACPYVCALLQFRISQSPAIFITESLPSTFATYTRFSLPLYLSISSFLPTPFLTLSLSLSLSLSHFLPILPYRHPSFTRSLYSLFSSLSLRSATASAAVTTVAASSIYIGNVHFDFFYLLFSLLTFSNWLRFSFLLLFYFSPGESFPEKKQ